MRNSTWPGNVHLQPSRPTVAWVASKEAWPAGVLGGRDSAPLLCSGETPPGLLRPALEPSAQERHGPAEVGEEEGHRNDRGWNTSRMRKG